MTTSYGPHSFPGGPQAYIRSHGSQREAHQRIQNALGAAFDSSNPDSIHSQISDRFGLNGSTLVNLDFINWGNVELIYLANLGREGRVVTSINQPHVEKGRIKTEYENLQRLFELNPGRVVEPLAYFSDDHHELYASEYVDRARCIFSGKGRPWGMFTPEPFYHFEGFSEEVTHAVTSSMIALLVALYDQERGQGIAKTQLAGDDFILTRDFDPRDTSSVLPNMKLIAAREMIEEPFEVYVDRVSKEFGIGTHYTHSWVVEGIIKVNAKSGLPMTPRAIAEGIDLGMKLRER